METSKTKKQKRIVVLMAAFALVTCSLLGGTFAKYITAGDGKSNNARIAKWGVTVTAEGKTFDKQYAKDDQSAGSFTNTVVSSTDDEVIAPGTKGEFATFTIKGTPEVAVEVTYVGQLDLEGWTVPAGTIEGAPTKTFYCPIVVTVDGVKFYGYEYDTAEAFSAAVEAKIGNEERTYEAGTDLNTQSVALSSITWEYCFDETADGKTVGNNAADTYLADQAAEGNNSTITLAIATTVTQID